MNQENKNKQSSAGKILGPDQNILWGLLIGTTIIFTIILYPNLVTQKASYQPGDIAGKDIKAQHDFFIEDADATETGRKHAAESVLTVYDHDQALLTEIIRNTRLAFSNLRKLFEAGEPGLPENNNINIDQILTEKIDDKLALHKIISEKKTEFEETIGIPVSKDAYRILENEKFSKAIEDYICTILREILSNGVVANKEILLMEVERGIILRIVGTDIERQVMSLKRFYGPDQAKTMVTVIGQPLLEAAGYTVRSLAVDFVQRLLSPNITLNRSETEARKEKAREDIKPFLYKVKAGEMLLREGERVTEIHIIKLKAMQTQTTEEYVIMSGLGTAMIIACLLWVSYTIHMKHQYSNAPGRNKNLLFILSILVIFVFIAKTLSPYVLASSYLVYGIPLAAGAMTVCLFMGIEYAVPFAMVLAICTAVIFRNRFDIFIYFMLSSVMAAYWMQECRERKAFIKAGMKLGFLNVVLVTAVDVYLADYSGLKLLWDWGFAFAGGMLAGIITAGIAPIVETVFGYTIDIKLLELANLDQPILRKLMIEAPGTYHHSAIVGNMVEAAASEIGANPLLAKVFGYYHDIGKSKKPLYFIENQRGGKNKHDKLAPSMSSLILIAHIKDGVEIAREHKLGEIIIDAIKQHHGTSLVSFFYEKARQLKGEDAVNIDNFRYPGPNPETREVGLVMLADIIEAASRTLENPTPSRIQGLVQKMINKAFSEGQLDNCELTLKDLHKIAKTYTNILNGIYHHRIEYADSPASNGGKGKNGSSDKQQAKPPKNITEKNSEDSANHLKRLGQS